MNLKNIDSLCKDAEINKDVREKLLDERKYLLNQHSKHLNSVLDIEKKTDLNDADKLLKQIDNLRSNVGRLSKDSGSIRNISLNESNSKQS